MTMEKEIWDFRYMMEIGCAGDLWRPSGKVCGKYRYLSTPAHFDEENNILTTASGSIYRICSFAANRQETIEQIKKDIVNKRCEVH